MEDEIFGPLLPIPTYSDLGKLLAKIKSLPKPLAGYVFSRNQQAVDQVVQSLSFGGGAVNQANSFLFIESKPYGGVGASGIGNYYGKYGYDSLTDAKSVLISPPDVAIDQLFPPYTKDKVQALHHRESTAPCSSTSVLTACICRMTGWLVYWSRRISTRKSKPFR
jgi:aldehyde dehydrogenase (NAD+)